MQFLPIVTTLYLGNYYEEVSDRVNDYYEIEEQPWKHLQDYKQYNSLCPRLTRSNESSRKPSRSRLLRSFLGVLPVKQQDKKEEK